jgi:hypothetical protein
LRCPACREPTARPKNICVNEYCPAFGERADKTFWTPKHLLEGVSVLVIMLMAMALPWLVAVLGVVLMIGVVVVLR